jgi:mannose-1-phosphate guanylyltransferase
MDRLWIDNAKDSPEAVVLIMAGGSGTRFWPLSRTQRPKQFLPLAAGGATLIQATARRFSGLRRKHTVVVVTAASQARLVAEQLPQASILAEPEPKNTAPCLAYAARLILERFGDVPVVAVPADHLIEQDDKLVEVFDSALDLADQDAILATIGIAPTGPETGFGYIKAGAVGKAGARAVEQFVEKPDRATAEEYLRSGNYLWNAGMFIWRPSVFLQAVKATLPELFPIVDKVGKEVINAERAGEVASQFKQITPISVDHGVMEKADNVVVFPGSGFSWSDVGSWDAWSEIASTRAGGPANVVGDNAFAVDSNGCMVSSEGGPLVALVGVEDLIVVSTKDAVLVCKKGDSQQVKKVIDLLRERGKTDLV